MQSYLDVASCHISLLGMPTPFELFLHSELDIERQRFENKWIANWHRINIDNQATDVDDFRGGRIRLGGVQFEGQPQQIYWDTFDRYLRIKIHDVFKQWNADTERYLPEDRLSSLEQSAGLLESFVGQLVAHATETDRRLRGRGFPKDVSPYNSTGSITKARAEIHRLKKSFSTQLQADKSTADQPSIPDMTNAFLELINGEAEDLEHSVSQKLLAIEAKHAAAGKLISGASVRAYVSAMLDGLSSYAAYLETEFMVFAEKDAFDPTAATSGLLPAYDRFAQRLAQIKTFSKLAKAVGGTTANDHWEQELARARRSAERQFKRLNLGLSPKSHPLEPSSPPMTTTKQTYDVFVSHASEDKQTFVQPFVAALKARGLEVWYDEINLSWGDSLRQEIDKGLALSRFGVVVLSKHFFAKPWPKTELDGLLTKELNGHGRVLPVWHQISKDEVAAESPIMVSKIARNTAIQSIEELADEVASLCGAATPLPSPISRPARDDAALNERLKQWHEAGRTAFEAEIAQRQTPKFLGANNLHFSYSIESSGDEMIAPSDLIEAVRDANRAIRDRVNTGWSMCHPYTEPDLRPYFSTDAAYRDGETDFLECSLMRKLNRSEAAHDFWRISPSGDLTLLRPFRLDFRTGLAERFRPQTWFSPSDLMREVGEIVRHAEALSAAFENPQSIAFRCEWRGLRGRDFIEPERSWRAGNQAQSDKRISKGTWPPDELMNDWPAIVAELIEPVVRSFRTDLILGADRILKESNHWRPIGNVYP